MVLEYRKCQVCSELTFFPGHECKPIWYVLWIDNDDEPRQIRGSNHKMASTTYADIVDANSGYEIGVAQGETQLFLWVLSEEKYNQLITLCEDDNSVINWQKLSESAEVGIKYRVQGEFVPSYYATEV